jgi:hypothetical protein
MVQFENAIKKFSKIILNELKENNIKCWIAGGSLRDYFSGISVKTDYDLFFPNEEEYKKAEHFFKNKQCLIKWESDNAMKVVYNNKTFDLVKKYFKDPISTINEFDFTVSMFAIDNEKVYHGTTTFIDLSKKQLMINKLPYPASTLSRSFIYYKKGYSMCMGEMKKLILSIQNMPIEEGKEKDNDKEDEDKGSGDSFFFGID